MAKTKLKPEPVYLAEIEAHKKKLKSLEEQKLKCQRLLERSEANLARVRKEHFYTYLVTSNGIPVYVGKGCNDRWNHAISGRSSVPFLNRDFFSDCFMEVFIWREGLTEEKALQEEISLVLIILANHNFDESKCPLYNHNVMEMVKGNDHLFLDVPSEFFTERSRKVAEINSEGWDDFKRSRKIELDDFMRNYGE